MRFRVISFFTILLLLCCGFKPLNKRSGGVRTIVIDAGHGGHDPGCQYNGKNEKNITLGIALKLGKIIKENCPGIKVIYTRKTDKFVELWERAAIANRNSADLFISIHVNANNTTKIAGTETYTMGLHKSRENLEVAKRENSVILMEDDYSAKYDGFNPKSPEANIIFSVFQDHKMTESVTLASKIEKIFTNKIKRKSRGVKQAGFLVLWKTTMPSVLIETGFLSNKPESSFLASEDGQTELARGILKAVRDYKMAVEANQD